MTPIQERALEILKRRPGLRCSQLGWELWGETTPSPQRGEGSHQNNKFCRPAGKVLNSLLRKTKVFVGTDGYGMKWYAL